MVFLTKKNNLDMTDGIVTLMALYWIKIFKSCNKHLRLFIRHLGLMTRKVLVDNLESQLNSIWYHQSIVDFKQLVKENSD